MPHTVPGTSGTAPALCAPFARAILQLFTLLQAATIVESIIASGFRTGLLPLQEMSYMLLLDLYHAPQADPQQMRQEASAALIL